MEIKMSSTDTKKVKIGSSHGWMALAISASLAICTFFIMIYIGEHHLNLVKQSDDLLMLKAISGVSSFFLFLILFVVLKIIFRRTHTKKALQPADKESTSTTNIENKSTQFKNKYAALAALALIVVLMVFTNPKINDFAMYAQNEVARGAQKNNSGGLGALLGGIGAAFLVNSTVRENYLLFSVYSTPFQGKPTKFIGIFGSFFKF
jgi:hypothetical protein